MDKFKYKIGDLVEIKFKNQKWEYEVLSRISNADGDNVYSIARGPGALVITASENWLVATSQDTSWGYPYYTPYTEKKCGSGHTWALTGMKITFCKECNIDGEWDSDTFGYKVTQKK